MDVDRIDIVIEAEAKKATAQLDIIIKKLEQVSSILPKFNSNGLNNMATGLKQIGKSMETMSNVKATDFNRLTKGIEKLSTINESALYKSANGIRNFANSLQGISSVSDDAVKLGEIANSISKLGGARIEKVITTLPRLSAALKEFMTTLSTAPNVSDNLIRMTNAMSSLASNGSKFSSTVNGLNRAAKTLTRSNNEVAVSTNKVDKVHKESTPHVASLTSQVNKLVGAYFTLKYVLGGIAESIKKSMDFNETINLFQTSYKKIGMEAAQKLGMDWGSKSADAYAKAFIDRAQAFNDKLTDALSLDPNTMMNYQAVFAQISSAMGLTANTAENISESFTLLGNDIASLWNIDTANAMQKLQAGLTGQVRPLRELGVDITQATLQLTAYKYGVDESVKKMSQAEKVQLRWLAIMDQSEVAFGDMAKTINSPANQIRVLKQQWDNLSRSIGNVFLPVISTILPYINAVVIALRSLIDTIAKAVGFELPDYSNSNIYTDVTGNIDGISDATDNAANSTDKATKANEKYKKSLMGFDELNILTDNSKSDSKKSDSGANTGGGSPILDDAINAKTASYMKKFNEELEKMSNKSKDLAKGITDFFAAIYKDAEPTRRALKKLWDEGLSKLADFTGKTLIDFYDDFLKPLGKWTLGKGLPQFLNTTNDLLNDIDWKSINKALDDLWKALEPFAENVGEGLLWCYDHVFKPIATLTVNKILVTFLEDLAKAVNVLNAVAEKFKNNGAVKGLLNFITDLSKVTVGNGAEWLKKIGDALDSLKDVVEKPSVKNVLKFLQELYDAFFASPASPFNLIDNVVESITGFDISENLNKLTDIGGQMMDSIIDGLTNFSLKDLKKFFNDLPGKIAGWVIGIPSKFKVKGKEIIDGIENGWGANRDKFKEWLKERPSDIANWFGELSGLFALKGLQLIKGIQTGWTNGTDTFKEWLKIRPDDISDWFGSLFKKFTKKGHQIIDGIEDGWNKGSKAFKKWLSGIPGEIADGIGSLFNAGADLIKSFINGFKSVVLPKLDIDVGMKKSKIPGVMIPSIDIKYKTPKYATGGFPEDGLFMANHGELVGQFSNGKTAVANNLQIQAGIEEASYRGYMRAAMQMSSITSSGNSGNTTVRVPIYIGKEQMAEAVLDGVNKRNRRFQTSVSFT